MALFYIKERSIFMMIIIIHAVFGTASLKASEIEVQPFEGEIFGGFTLPLESYHSGTAQISMTLGLEGRYNFARTGWDCGAMLSLSTARHKYRQLYDDGYDRWQNNRSLSLAAVVNYNFRQGENINPFVGCALGVASNDVVGDRCFPSKGVSMLFAPQLGVEIIHHIRVRGQFNICRKGYNNFSLSIGFVLGGRPKKR